jgi:2-hydroxy-3-keto-5-methylthiopentenyl-1-phosphate phosphatase
MSRRQTINMTTHNKLTSLFTEPFQPKLFMDFDGTISKVDVIDAILEKFADGRWLETEREWLSGKIGSRECLRKQFSYVNASQDEMIGLIDALDIDRGFQSILEFCREADLNVHIVSDGFEEYIRRMLERSLADPFDMARITISANSLVSLGGGRWDTAFPHTNPNCRDGCATCKPAVMRSHNPFSASTIFVGDGLSDKYAARAADVVFAKAKLADYCSENSIPHAEYRNLGQIAESLEKALESCARQIPNYRIAWAEAV